MRRKGTAPNALWDIYVTTGAAGRGDGKSWETIEPEDVTRAVMDLVNDYKRLRDRPAAEPMTGVLMAAPDDSVSIEEYGRVLKELIAAGFEVDRLRRKLTETRDEVLRLEAANEQRLEERATGYGKTWWIDPANPEVRIVRAGVRNGAYRLARVYDVPGGLVVEAGYSDYPRPGQWYLDPAGYAVEASDTKDAIYAILDFIPADQTEGAT